ncbi:hypothetical protein G9F72_007280 [Clostridium estertheticum]|uniref:Imm43 family immunity protein n=1 Tax=Clostridium estertheticum TaxID=238834 RepID=UPI0013E96450|nr:DUF1629 domain-containing protein [Clostridium estertheticum]MBZ9686134.1 hypothetical protein [Clostridium estertheticum]
MNYFTLQYDMKKYERNGVMAYHSELYGIGMHDIIRGNHLYNWDKRITFNYTPDNGSEITDYICNDFRWLIVSNKFREAFENAHMTGIQYLPLSIINKETGIALGEYYVANICNLIEAVDMGQSEYIELMPGKYVFASFAVKEDKINSFDIFRLKEYNVSILLSEKFKNIIKINKLTGFNFTKVKVV